MSGLAGLLQGAHALAAMKRGPHWLLSETDSKAYALAWGNFLRHFALAKTQKYVDAAALVMAIGFYEGPRIAMDRNLARQVAQPRRGPAQVFQFNPPPGGNGAVPPSPVDPNQSILDFPQGSA